MSSDRVVAPSCETLAEILSQPEAWSAVLGALGRNAVVPEILRTTSRASEWLFLGCGTSFYLAEAAAATWTLLTGVPARALPASEALLFPKLALPSGNGTQALVISRSGSTSEAVRAARQLREQHKIPTLGLTCTPGTPLEAACDATITLSGAEEKSTVMTRSFTAMLAALQYLASRRAALDSYGQALDRLAEHCAPLLPELNARVASFVAQNTFAAYVFLGQGPFFPVAREAALKVTEMSCSYGQAFHTLEFRHGPKAIVGPETCLVFFLSESNMQTETEVLTEMKALGATTVTVANRGSAAVRASSDLAFEFLFDGPETALLAPFVVPAQLLGVHTGLKKGLDPDHPRHLSRVVILD